MGRPRESSPAGSWRRGDRCAVMFNDQEYPGNIKQLFVKRGTARVVFDDGDELTVNMDELIAWHDPEDDPTLGEGFNQYPVRWRDHNFSFGVDGTRFYGSWRRATFTDGTKKLNGYAIDMWAEHNGKTYTTHSQLGYPGRDDPRGDIPELNRDLCAAANLWLYKTKSTIGGVHVLADLHRRADRPKLHITNLGTLDRMIRKLMEYRETAIRSGGQRVLGITGDGTDEGQDVTVEIHINLTEQALALRNSKVPNLLEGAVFDNLSGRRRKDGSRGGEAVTLTPDKANVDELVSLLERSTDEREKRKIRTTLRKMGHKGGARTARKEPTKPTDPDKRSGEPQPKAKRKATRRRRSKSK